MKKFYTLLVSAIMASTSAIAQTTTISLGYCDEVVAGCFGDKTEAKGAIYIPAELAQIYKGAKVTGVKFGLVKSMQNVKIFLTKDLNGTPVTEKTLGTSFNGFNNAKFDEAYTITGEAFYVGYSYSGDTEVLGYSHLYNPNGCWADLGDGWKDYASDPDFHSNALAIQARVTGSNLPKDLALVNVSNTTSKKSTPFNITGTVMSYSPKTTTSYSIAYSIDGGKEQTATINKSIKAGATGTFSIEHPGIDKNGTHTIECRIVDVNGEADPYEGNNKASGYLGVASSRQANYRMVCEEGTGTWCQACPLGIVGMEYMYNKYPNNFVGIAVHPSDGGREHSELVPSGYSAINFTSYPSAYINRSADMYLSPSANNLEAAYLETLNGFRLGEIEVNSDFTDGSKNAVNATATMTFVSDIYSSNYKVAFVMTENKVTGYRQSNAYAGSSTPMGGFENMSSNCEIDLDHVAREIWGYNGLDNSVPEVIKEGVPVTFTKTLKIPKNVKNVDNIQVIALLFNTTTGVIENAAEAKVGNSSGTTAITDIANKPEPQIAVIDGMINVNGYDGNVCIYTIDGKPIANKSLSHGIYIVKGNGSNKFVKRIAI